MNKRYIKGRNFEYQIKKMLERDGYYVIRSAGSHGAFDLVAIKGNEVKLFQLKNVRSRKKMSSEIFCITVKEYLKNKKYYKGKIIRFLDIPFKQFLVKKNKKGKVVFEKL